MSNKSTLLRGRQLLRFYLTYYSSLDVSILKLYTQPNLELMDICLLQQDRGLAEESFPIDWTQNPVSVKKTLALWQTAMESVSVKSPVTLVGEEADIARVYDLGVFLEENPPKPALKG